MNFPAFPSPMNYLPRPGMREIRSKPAPALPHARYERKCENVGTENKD